MSEFWRAFLNLILLGVAFMVFFAVVLVSIGKYSRKEYKGSRARKFKNASSQTVWRYLRDPLRQKEIRKELKQIERTDRSTIGLPQQWTEHLKQNGTIEITVKEEQEPQRLILYKRGKKLGMEGIWTYHIRQIKNDCLVEIHEESITTSILSRLLLVLAGRDANLKQELGDIHYALLNAWAEQQKSRAENE